MAVSIAFIQAVFILTLPRWAMNLPPCFLKLDAYGLLSIFIAALFSVPLLWRFAKNDDPDDALHPEGDPAPGHGGFFAGRSHFWIACALGVLALVCSATGVAFTSTGYFNKRIPYDRPLLLVALAVAMSLGFGFVRPSRKTRRLGLLALLILGEIGCIYGMLEYTTGLSMPPYTDDHPSFMFRMCEFYWSFPYLENFVPYWNAGVVNSVLVSSGTPGFAALAAPFLLSVDLPHLAYTPALLFVFTFLLPWSTVWAFREAKFSWETSLCGGILSICPGRHIFLWLLNYGTAGASMSMCFSVPAALFVYAITIGKSRRKSCWIGAVVMICLCAQWEPMILSLLAISAASLLQARHWLSWRRALWLAIAAGVVGIVLSRNIIATIGAKDLLSYTAARGNPIPGAGRLFHDTCVSYSKELLSASPIVYVLGSAGFFLLAWRRVKWWLCWPIAWLMLISVFGPYVRPRMQLERLMFDVSLLLTIPAAIWASEILSLRAPGDCARPRLRAAFRAIAAGSTLAVMTFSVGNTWLYYHSVGVTPYECLPRSINVLVDFVKENAPENTRVLFAGPTVHMFGHGHVAYLPIMSGREMMSCDYYGFPPGFVEPEYPFAATRSQPGGMEGFMKRHGVSYVVTSHARHVEYMDSRPDSFTKVAMIGSEYNFWHAIYRLSNDVQIVDADAGVKVSPMFNRVAFESRSGEPIAKPFLARYNWNERMSVSAPATMAPEPNEFGETFVRINPNGASRIELRYKPRF